MNVSPEVERAVGRVAIAAAGLDYMVGHVYVLLADDEPRYEDVMAMPGKDLRGHIKRLALAKIEEGWRRYLLGWLGDVEALTLARHELIHSTVMLDADNEYAPIFVHVRTGKQRPPDAVAFERLVTGLNTCSGIGLRLSSDLRQHLIPDGAADHLRTDHGGSR